MSITRRGVLLTISQLAAAAVLGACGRSPGGAASGQQDVELLASVAYDILPFPELPPELYVRAASQILESGGSDIAGGIEELRRTTSGTAWKDLEETTRIKALESIQGSPFFRTLRGATVQVLLRDPATHQIVGYGGSTITKGGYLNRGFDDISWLPAEQKK